MGLFDFLKKWSNSSQKEDIHRFNQETIEEYFGGMVQLEDDCRKFLHQTGMNVDIELAKGLMISAASFIKLNGEYNTFIQSALKISRGGINKEQLKQLFEYVKYKDEPNYNSPHNLVNNKKTVVSSYNSGASRNNHLFEPMKLSEDDIDTLLIQTDQFIYHRGKEKNFIVQNGRVLPTDQSLEGMALSSIFIWLKVVNKLNRKLYSSVISKYESANHETEDAMREYLHFHFKIEESPNTIHIKELYSHGKAIISFLESMAPYARNVAENMMDKKMLHLPYDDTRDMITIYGFDEDAIADIIGRDYQNGVVSEGLKQLKKIII